MRDTTKSAVLFVIFLVIFLLLAPAVLIAQIVSPATRLLGVWWNALFVFSAPFGVIMLLDPDEYDKVPWRAMAVCLVTGAALFVPVYFSRVASIPLWWSLSNLLIAAPLIGVSFWQLTVAQRPQKALRFGLVGAWFAAASSIALFTPWPVWAKVLNGVLTPVLIVESLASISQRGVDTVPQILFWRALLFSTLAVAGWTGATRHWGFFSATVIAVLLVLSAIGRSEERALEAAWRAAVAHMDARTPPGEQTKTTREHARGTGLGRVEIDFVVASRAGSERTVRRGTVALVRSDGEWHVEALRQHPDGAQDQATSSTE